MASCCGSGCTCQIIAGANVTVSGVGSTGNPFVISSTGGGGGGGGAVSSVNSRTGDVVLTKSDVGLSNVNNTTDLNKPISNAVAQMVQWAKIPDAIITGGIVRNSNNVATAASVIWPDGSTGTFTTDVIGPLNSVDAYHITYVNGATTKTFTQPLVTRNSAGYTTNIPAIVVT